MRDPDVRRAVRQSVDALDQWVTRNGWAGFDPHDIRGTPLFMFLLRPIRSIPLKIARRLALAPLLRFEMLFPRLARRAFGVNPTINAKGMALFARGYLQLYAISADETHRAKAVDCLEWLSANTSPGYNEPCWGYPFDWQSGVVTPGRTPASVVTSAVGDAFWTAYRTFGDRRYLTTCEGICRGFLQYLRRDDMPDGTVCFSYTPIDDFHVHNANLLVAEFLVRVGTETKNDEWVELGIRAGRYALAEQNADGSLYYWGRIQDHQCPGCVDHYHSGFEIRCLYGIAQHTGRTDFLQAARRYFEFYRHNLVIADTQSVRPKMTPRSFYPVNIHSCAEGIIVQATMSREMPEAGALLDRFTQWVIANMQMPSGAFAYMRWRFLGRERVNRMPYLRWGQGWMLLALSQYLLTAREATSEHRSTQAVA
jgi:hypothetical protein